VASFLTIAGSSEMLTLPRLLTFPAIARVGTLPNASRLG
jgi:hypothetical protein